MEVFGKNLLCTTRVLHTGILSWWSSSAAPLPAQDGRKLPVTYSAPGDCCMKDPQTMGPWDFICHSSSWRSPQEQPQSIFDAADKNCPGYSERSFYREDCHLCVLQNFLLSQQDPVPLFTGEKVAHVISIFIGTRMCIYYKSTVCDGVSCSQGSDTHGEKQD